MACEAILRYLKSGSWISGEEMASRLGVSRAAVWKQIRGLRNGGYEIKASTKRGYMLVREPELLDADTIRAGLKTKHLGKDLRCYREVDSTNEVAKSIVGSCLEGTVVLAETQTQGKGRLARPWASPPGGVWMSLILKPNISLAQVYQINMSVSVAIAKTIVGLYGLKVGIKWPNDILINERKICGILTEVNAEVDKLDYAIVGVGINANVEISGFPQIWKATSLLNELGKEISRIDFIQRILQELENAYEKIGSRQIYEEWRNLSITLGKCVQIRSIKGDLVGEAFELSEDGALCLKTKEGLMRVVAGDCIHLRSSEIT